MDITSEISMTIKFAEMVQMNKKSKFVRRIRLALELKDENGFFVYQWQNEHKKWDPYNADAMVQIAGALDKDQTSLSLTCQSRSYDIDLKKSVQTNTSTNVIRKVQRVKSSLFFLTWSICDCHSFVFLVAKLPLAASSVGATSNKRTLDDVEEEEKEEADEQPKSNKRRATSKSTGSAPSSSAGSLYES